MPTQADLFFWNDPDDLLKALHRLDRNPVPDLHEAIERLLNHSDPDIREESLRILLTRWKDQSVRPQAVSALESDSAPNVRSAAAYGIAATSTVASRSEDSRLLLSVLDSNEQDLEVRAAAYDALVILHRKGTGEGGWPFATKRSEFNPMVDVDWDWIRSL